LHTRDWKWSKSRNRNYDRDGSHDGVRTHRKPWRGPHVNARISWDLGLGSATDPDAGFCEVLFPDIRIDPTERVDRGDAPRVASSLQASVPCVA
jgi:hypothetical protein